MVSRAALRMLMAALGQAAAFPTNFSANFGDRMVLQRGPERASVYGFVESPVPTDPPAITVSVTGTTRSNEMVSESYPATVFADGTWKATLAAKPAGGSLTIAVACANCKTAAAPVAINDVTFGDVWMCSGQSNMELSLGFTFDRNHTIAAIANGSYDNVRVYLSPHLRAAKPVYVSNGLAPSKADAGDAALSHAPDAESRGGSGSLEFAWTKVRDAVNSSDVQGSALMGYSAACWYFGKGLTDIMKREGAEIVPLGMMGVSWGGTLIEQWTKIELQPTCSEIAELAPTPKLPGNAEIYNGMVATFVNMTVKGFAWYQGENNCGGYAGNILDHTGYACMLQQMATGWVADFAAVPGTTSPNASFGIVTLADGGWEGNPADAGLIHWAETLNYGVVPNPALPNGFVAAAHDVGDPWNSQGCTQNGCCRDTTPPNVSNGCSGDTRWMVKTSRLDPRTGGWVGGLVPIYPNTPHLMSSVHPRTKHFVGDRLAAAAWNVAYGHKEHPATGPVIAGCQVVGTQLELYFDSALLGSDSLVVKPYNRTNNASATQILVGTPFPVNASKNHDAGPKVMDYPPWKSADIAQGTRPNSVTVELGSAAAAARLTGVRYARWAKVSHPLCCGDVDFAFTPCPPNSCPLSAAKSDLPAMPFEAEIVDGKCKCMAPQTCDYIPAA